MNRRLLVCFLILAASLASAEWAGIAGKVVDASNGSPLGGVQVWLERTTLGDNSLVSGEFTIRRIPPGEYTLQASLLGYKSRTVSVSLKDGETDSIRIELSSSPINANPVVITAAKHPQDLATTSQAVVVVSADQLKARQTRRLEEMLAPIAGVHFNEESISIRGSGGYTVFNVGSRVLLMVDGVPLTTSDLGAISWKTLPLLDIDRVEVVKGAGSALYGSQAMGGVVNLITKEPDPAGRLTSRMTAGWYDKPHDAVWRWTDRRLHYERLDLSYGRRIGVLGIRLGLSRYKSTGYMENNKSDQWNLSGRFNFRFNNGSRLDVDASWLKHGEGGFIQWLDQRHAFEVPEWNKNDEIHLKMRNFYLRWQWPVLSNLALKVRVSYLESLIGNQLTTYDPGAFKPGEGSGTEIQADWMLGTHTITFGTEGRLDVMGSEYFANHKGYSLAFYGQDEWTIRPNLTATAGVRFDSHVLHDETHDTRTSPKFGVNWKPVEGTVIRATAGAGFRAATVFEKYIDVDYSIFIIKPNPGLRSERAWFGDFGVRQDFWNLAQLELSVFRSDYWDLIEPVKFQSQPPNQIIQFLNYNRARITGLECTAEAWLPGRHLGMTLAACWMNPEDILMRETLPYRPKRTVDVGLNVAWGGFSASAEYRYASRVDKVWLFEDDQRVPVKLLHLRAQMRMAPFTVQVMLSNALNYQYAQVERRMDEIRNLSVSLLTDLGI